MMSRTGSLRPRYVHIAGTWLTSTRVSSRLALDAGPLSSTGVSIHLLSSHELSIHYVPYTRLRSLPLPCATMQLIRRAQFIIFRLTRRSEEVETINAVTRAKQSPEHSSHLNVRVETQRKKLSCSVRRQERQSPVRFEPSAFEI